jgi:hypothetical protein
MRRRLGFEKRQMEFGQPLRYEEDIAAPWWLMAILLASLIALIGSMVVVPLDPNAGWQIFVWYYPLMTVVGVLLIGVTIAFRRLHIEVGNSAARVSFGFIRKTFLLTSITSCQAQKYHWLTYGGWGIRYSTGGRRAWSMPGVPDGVEITLTEGRKVRRYFVSSRSPELLAAAVAVH